MNSQSSRNSHSSSASSFDSGLFVVHLAKHLMGDAAIRKPFQPPPQSGFVVGPLSRMTWRSSPRLTEDDHGLTTSRVLWMDVTVEVLSEERTIRCQFQCLIQKAQGSDNSSSAGQYQLLSSDWMTASDWIQHFEEYLKIEVSSTPLAALAEMMAAALASTVTLPITPEATGDSANKGGEAIVSAVELHYADMGDSARLPLVHENPTSSSRGKVVPVDPTLVPLLLRPLAPDPSAESVGKDEKNDEDKKKNDDSLVALYTAWKAPPPAATSHRIKHANSGSPASLKPTPSPNKKVMKRKQGYGLIKKPRKPQGALAFGKKRAP